MSVRRVRAHEWERARELRLRSLADPDAPLAFTTSLADAVGQPEGMWRRRTADAAAGPKAALYVLEDDGEWLGCATVIAIPEDARAALVAVWVDPRRRGSGAVEALVAACADWARDTGFDALYLDVAEANTRAVAAYTRCGFTPTGVRLPSAIGPTVELVRPLPSAT